MRIAGLIARVVLAGAVALGATSASLAQKKLIRVNHAGADDSRSTASCSSSTT